MEVKQIRIKFLTIKELRFVKEIVKWNTILMVLNFLMVSSLLIL